MVILRSVQLTIWASHCVHTQIAVLWCWWCGHCFFIWMRYEFYALCAEVITYLKAKNLTFTSLIMYIFWALSNHNSKRILFLTLSCYWDVSLLLSVNETDPASESRQLAMQCWRRPWVGLERTSYHALEIRSQGKVRNVQTWLYAESVICPLNYSTHFLPRFS